MNKQIITESINKIFIQESTSSNNLPGDLINFLQNVLYPKYYGKGTKPMDLDKEHKKALDNIKEWGEHDGQYKDYIDCINKENLFFLVDYTNGDSAWYCSKDKKVYDWNHEGYGFNHPSYKGYKNVKNSDRKNLWEPQFYKQWMIDIKKDYHRDSWKVIFR